MMMQLDQEREARDALLVIADAVMKLQRSRKVSRAAAYGALVGMARHMENAFVGEEREAAAESADHVLQLVTGAIAALPAEAPAALEVEARVLVIPQEPDPLIRAALVCMQMVETTADQWSMESAAVLGAFDAALRVLAHDDHDCGDPSCAMRAAEFREMRDHARDQVMAALQQRVQRSTDQVMH